MNQKALKTLEFDKIIHILTAHAASEGAKEIDVYKRQAQYSAHRRYLHIPGRTPQVWSLQMPEYGDQPVPSV